MEVSDQSHVPAALHPRRELPVLIGWDVRLVPEPVWTRWRREKFLPLSGVEHRSSSPLPVT